jgi:hypothetical protein
MPALVRRLLLPHGLDWPAFCGTIWRWPCRGLDERLDPGSERLRTWQVRSQMGGRDARLEQQYYRYNHFYTGV